MRCNYEACGGLVLAVYISRQLDLAMLSIYDSFREPGFSDELLAKKCVVAACASRCRRESEKRDALGHSSSPAGERGITPGEHTADVAAGATWHDRVGSCSILRPAGGGTRKRTANSTS
jgi:hypothetical protein